MASTPGFEPGPHWWEASALTTAPPIPTLPLAHVADVIYPRVDQKLVSSATQVGANPLADNNFHKKYYLATILFRPDACEDVTEHTEEGNAFVFKRPSSSSSILLYSSPFDFHAIIAPSCALFALFSSYID